MILPAVFVVAAFRLLAMLRHVARKYSGVSLSRTCAISNIALSRTKTSVPSAFKPSLGKICLAISNFAISNFPLSRTFFWSLETNYNLYLKLLLKPLIETSFVFIRTFDFRIFERSMNGMFFFELCLSVFLYFYTVYLLLRDSQDTKKKTYCKNSKWFAFHNMFSLFLSHSLVLMS